MKTELTLQQAKRIAGRVGARIVQNNNTGSEPVYEVTIAGRSFKDLDGSQRLMLFYARSPLEAAHTAIVQTGAYCKALVEVCKRTYVDEDALWQSGFHGGTSA